MGERWQREMKSCSEVIHGIEVVDIEKFCQAKDRLVFHLGSHVLKILHLKLMLTTLCPTPYTDKTTLGDIRPNRRIKVSRALQGLILPYTRDHAKWSDFFHTQLATRSLR